MQESDLGSFTAQVMHKLCVIAHRQNSAELASVYFDVLRPYSLEDVLGACHVYWRRDETSRMPAPAILLDIVREISNRKHGKAVEPEPTDAEKLRYHVSLVFFQWSWMPVRIDTMIWRVRTMDADALGEWWMKQIDQLVTQPEKVTEMDAEVKAGKSGFDAVLASCRTRMERIIPRGEGKHAKARR